MVCLFLSLMELALEVLYFLVLAFQDFLHLFRPLLKLLPLLRKIKLLLHCGLLVFKLTQFILRRLYLYPNTLQGLVVKTPSHQPFHHNHGLKRKEGVRKKAKWNGRTEGRRAWLLE